MEYGAIDLHKRKIRSVTESGAVVDRRIATTRERLTAVFATSERDVDATVTALLRQAQGFDYASVQALVVTPPSSRVPMLHLPLPDLAQYDALLLGGGRC
jgi:hypothetical protein